MTGSIQIGITRLKDAFGPRGAVDGIVLGTETATSVFGGSAKSADRQAVYARERAKLDAYNSELGAKGCPMIDIEAELARPAEGPKKY